MMEKLHTDDKHFLRLWNECRGRHDWEGVMALELMDRSLARAWDDVRRLRQELEQTEEHKAKMAELATRQKNWTRPADHRAPAEADG